MGLFCPESWREDSSSGADDNVPNVVYIVALVGKMDIKTDFLTFAATTDDDDQSARERETRPTDDDDDDVMGSDDIRQCQAVW